jgi:hypothetical protein
MGHPHGRFVSPVYLRILRLYWFLAGGFVGAAVASAAAAFFF